MRIRLSCLIASFITTTTAITINAEESAQYKSSTPVLDLKMPLRSPEQARKSLSEKVMPKSDYQVNKSAKSAKSVKLNIDQPTDIKVTDREPTLLGFPRNKLLLNPRINGNSKNNQQAIIKSQELLNVREPRNYEGQQVIDVKIGQRKKSEK